MEMVKRWKVAMGWFGSAKTCLVGDKRIAELHIFGRGIKAVEGCESRHWKLPRG